MALFATFGPFLFFSLCWVFLVTDFDEKQAEEIVAKLAYLDKKDPGVPIDLYIETSGGRGYDPVALFIQTMKSC